ATARRAVVPKTCVRQTERVAHPWTRVLPRVAAAALGAAFAAALVLFAAGGHRHASRAVPPIPSWPQSSSLVPPPGTLSLTVHFRRGTSPAARERLPHRLGGVDGGAIPELGLHVVTVPTARAATLLHRLGVDPSVTTADPDRVRGIAAAVSDPAYSEQWALERIGWQSAYRSVKPRRRVTIAVLDTGVDGRLPDLAARLAPG